MVQAAGYLGAPQAAAYLQGDVGGDVGWGRERAKEKTGRTGEGKGENRGIPKQLSTCKAMWVGRLGEGKR